VRGDVHRLRSPRDARGHEQRGERFAVVVQADALSLSILLVAPTSTGARPVSFRPEIVVGGRRTLVLAEQTAAIAPERLGDRVGRLTAAEQAEVDAALVTVLGLSRPHR